MRRFRGLVAVALAVAIAPAFAQEGGTKLEWKFEKDKTFYQEMKTTTEGDGTFVFQQVPAGAFTLRIPGSIRGQGPEPAGPREAHHAGGAPF